MSFHKYNVDENESDIFFPGTGALGDIGSGLGLGYSVNVPLRDGITSEAYAHIFKSVISDVVKHYGPSAIGKEETNIYG